MTGSMLVALWSGVGWLLAHQRRIKGDLTRDEALPRPGPRGNLLLLWSVVLLGISGLLLYFTFG